MKQKLIAKCVRFIITKCDNFITKCVGTTNNKSKKKSEKIWRSNLVKNQNIDSRIKLTKIHRPLLRLTLSQLSHFLIPDALSNNNLSHFVIPDAPCNNNLSHFAIILPCCTLQCEICQKSIRNEFSHFVIRQSYLSTFLPSYLPRLHFYFHKTYDHHTWLVGEL